MTRSLILPHRNLHSVEQQANFEAIEEFLTVEDWHLPALEHAWANAGAPFATAAYLRDPFGFVHIRGLITGGEANKSAFILPKEYRPGATEQFTSFTGGVAVTFIEVTAAGLVIPNAGATSVRISGISFLAEG